MRSFILSPLSCVFRFCVETFFHANLFSICRVHPLIFAFQFASLLFFLNCLVAESQGFSKDICRSMVAMLDLDHSGKLGLEEFKSLLNDIAKWKVIDGFKDLLRKIRVLIL